MNKFSESIEIHIEKTSKKKKLVQSIFEEGTHVIRVRRNSSRRDPRHFLGLAST